MKINFGVIGTNVITERFLEAGKDAEGFCLRGVYSRSREKAVDFARKHGADLAFDSLEAMRSVYSPGFQAIRENLHKLGKIRRVSFQYCQYSRRYDNFKKGIIENAFNPALSNGALMDIGVYCVHPLVSLFGKPEKVISSSLKLSNGIDGAGTILTEYPDFQGELLYSKITDSRVPSQIQGEEGSMVIREIPDPQEVVLYYRDGRTETLEIPRTENNMVYEIREFLRLIREKRYSHEYLENSQMEIELMDEVRRQQKIFFPADRKSDH